MQNANSVVRDCIRSDAITLEKTATRLLTNTKCLVNNDVTLGYTEDTLQRLLFARNAIQQAVVLITRGVEDPSTDPART